MKAERGLELSTLLIEGRNRKIKKIINARNIQLVF